MKKTKNIFKSILALGKICMPPSYFLSSFALVIIAYILIGLASFSSGDILPVVAFLFLIFSCIGACFMVFRRHGITRIHLYALATGCIMTILFYGMIYNIYGFSYGPGDKMSYLYRVVPAPDPQRFLNALYFSTVTFTTLGYGDLKPIPELRLVCASEAIAGYFWLGLFMGCIMAYLLKIDDIQRKRKTGRIANFVVKSVNQSIEKETEKKRRDYHRRFRSKQSKGRIKRPKI